MTHTPSFRSPCQTLVEFRLPLALGSADCLCIALLRRTIAARCWPSRGWTLGRFLHPGVIRQHAPESRAGLHDASWIFSSHVLPPDGGKIDRPEFRMLYVRWCTLRESHICLRCNRAL